MTLTSLQWDIIERRIQNGARVTFDDYTYYAEPSARLSPAGEMLNDLAERLGTTRKEILAMRQMVAKISKECEERLATEMTFVYTLNEERTRVLGVQHLTKGDAAEIARIVVPGELLDLDDIFGGLLVRGSYVFVSEIAAANGLQKYQPAALLNGLVKERLAA